MTSNKKNILVLNRSFWPDIEATGQFLTELCEQLTRKYKVTVIAGRSYYVKEEKFKPGGFYYRDLHKEIEILRVRHTKFWKGHLLGRMTNWLTYSVLVFFSALRVKSDLIIVCTDPPFLGFIAMIISRIRSVPFIFNCRDLYPDVALGLGRLKPGLLSKVFDCINRKAICKSMYVVCLGQSMVNRIQAKGVSSDIVKMIPDWVDTREIKPVPKEDNSFLEKIASRDKFIIMYSGNLGLSQDFSSVFLSLSRIKDRYAFCLIFIGEGAGKEKLKKEARSFGLENIAFFPYQPKTDLSLSLSAADLHLIPLKKGMAGASVPSKMYGIMAAGKPYVAITDEESEPARLAKEYACGLWVAPDDIEAMTKAFTWSMDHQNELEKMGQAARRLAEEKFDKNIAIDEWFKLLETL